MYGSSKPPEEDPQRRARRSVRPFGQRYGLRRRESRTLTPPMLAWAAYFATAPVVWLPGLSIPAIAAIKAILFGTAVWLTWVSVDRPRLPPGILGPLGAVAVVFSASFGLFQANSATSVGQTLFSFGLPFVVLWSFWNLPQLRGNILQFAIVSATVLALLSAVIVYANIARPRLFFGPNPLGFQAAWVSGFGTLSTGWSHGVALFVPFLAVRTASARGRTALIALAGIALIIAGQLIVFGRGGLLISVLSVLAVVAMRLRAEVTWLLVVAMAVVIPLVILATDAAVPDASQESGGIGFEEVDDFSSNRLELVRQGLAVIAERPLVGYGFGNDRLGIGQASLQVHVTWMRMAVQGGLAFPAMLLVIVLIVSRRAMLVLRQQVGTDDYLPLLASVLVIFGGITASFVEPNAIMGTFHTSAIWWAAAGSASRLAFDMIPLDPRSRNRHWQETTTGRKASRGT